MPTGRKLHRAEVKPSSAEVAFKEAMSSNKGLNKYLVEITKSLTPVPGKIRRHKNLNSILSNLEQVSLSFIDVKNVDRVENFFIALTNGQPNLFDIIVTSGSATDIKKLESILNNLIRYPFRSRQKLHAVLFARILNILQSIEQHNTLQKNDQKILAQLSTWNAKEKYSRQFTQNQWKTLAHSSVASLGGLHLKKERTVFLKNLKPFLADFKESSPELFASTLSEAVSENSLDPVIANEIADFVESEFSTSLDLTSDREDEENNFDNEKKLPEVKSDTRKSIPTVDSDTSVVRPSFDSDTSVVKASVDSDTSVVRSSSDSNVMDGSRFKNYKPPETKPEDHFMSLNEAFTPDKVDKLMVQIQKLLKTVNNLEGDPESILNRKEVQKFLSQTRNIELSSSLNVQLNLLHQQLDNPKEGEELTLTETQQAVLDQFYETCALLFSYEKTEETVNNTKSSSQKIYEIDTASDTVNTSTLSNRFNPSNISQEYSVDLKGQGVQLKKFSVENRWDEILDTMNIPNTDLKTLRSLSHNHMDKTLASLANPNDKDTYGQYLDILMSEIGKVQSQCKLEGNDEIKAKANIVVGAYIVAICSADLLPAQKTDCLLKALNHNALAHEHKALLGHLLETHPDILDPKMLETEKHNWAHINHTHEGSEVLAELLSHTSTQKMSGTRPTFVGNADISGHQEKPDSSSSTPHNHLRF